MSEIQFSGLSKSELLVKCQEKGILKCKSKSKNELIKLLNPPLLPSPVEGSPNILIHGDCMTEMQNIQDGTIDMILCDLPYGMTKNSWDVIIPFDKLWSEYNRIIKDTGGNRIVWVSTIHFTYDNIQSENVPLLSCMGEKQIL